MRLTKEQFSAIMEADGWRPLNNYDTLYERIRDADNGEAGFIQGAISELKPDRRAELLELASRLAVTHLSALPVTIDGTLTMTPSIVKLAAAIIAEVDRVSGEAKS